MTLAEQAYAALRRDILDGVLTPMQPLRLDHLRQRYGMGFSPLREALNRLQAERLVVSVALRGFTVAPLSRAEMWDAIETRILIETEALRRAIARGGDHWESRVVAALHGLSLQAARLAGDPVAQEELEARHHEFHQALISACGSPRLLDLSQRLYAETERYRRPALAAGAAQAEGGRDVAWEHAALMQAALGRDAERAAALLTAHYRATGTALESRYDAGEKGSDGSRPAAARPAQRPVARQAVSR